MYLVRWVTALIHNIVLYVQFTSGKKSLMSREGILSVKQKWALDAQLGELLRGMEPKVEAQKPTPEEQFQERLDSLLSEFKLDKKEAVDIARLLC